MVQSLAWRLLNLLQVVILSSWTAFWISLALVVSVLAEDLVNGKSLSDENQERLTLATSRISGAMDAAPPLKRPEEIRELRSPAR